VVDFPPFLHFDAARRFWSVREGRNAFSGDGPFIIEKAPSNSDAREDCPIGVAVEFACLAPFLQRFPRDHRYTKDILGWADTTPSSKHASQFPGAVNT